MKDTDFICQLSTRGPSGTSKKYLIIIGNNFLAKIRSAHLFSEQNCENFQDFFFATVETQNQNLIVLPIL